MVKEAVVSPAIFLSVVAYVFIGAGILMAFEQPTELHNCELANQAIATIIKQIGAEICRIIQAVNLSYSFQDWISIFENARL